MPGSPSAAEELTPTKGLRRRVARGSLINGAFLVGVNALNVARGVLVVAFISPADFGVWGILSVTIGILLVLRRVGFTEKFVQQDNADQVLEFQKVLTLEVAYSALLAALSVVVVPVAALAYGRDELVLPGLIFALTLPGLALHAPLAIFYRKMDFARQRLLQSADPIVGFVVTIGLAVAGTGYWSLVIGSVAGAWAAAIVAVVACPYPLRLRFDRDSAREYLRFSWPLLLAGLVGVVMGQAILLLGEARLGLVGAGIITLAWTISMYANRLDQVITTTMYPAICRAQDRPAVLLETFLKSNRLAMMWGVPFGVGLAIFADALVVHVLGADWEPGVRLLQSVGIMAALHQLGFNWDAFYRARGETRPVAVMSAVGLGSFLLLVLPAMWLWELDGLAVGFLVMEVVVLTARAAYVRRLFPKTSFLRPALRALAPPALAGCAVVGMRLLGVGDGGAVDALAEGGLFVVVLVAFTWFAERALLREIGGYLRTRRPLAGT